MKPVERLIFSISLMLAFLPESKADVTLQECRDRARENYPLVRKYGIIQAVKECNVSNASMAWAPRIALNVQGGFVNGTLSGDDFGELLKILPDPQLLASRRESPWQYSVGVGLTQNIWDGGASSLGRKSAEAQAAADLAEAEVSMFEVERQVDEVFFAILLLEERQKQVSGRISLLEHNLECLRNAYSQGAASETDVMSLEVEILSAGQELDALRSSLSACRMSLSLLTAVNVSNEKLLTPSRPDMSQTVPRPEFLMFEMRKKQLELGYRKLDAELQPKVAFCLDSYYGYPGRNIVKNLLSRVPTFNVVVGVRLNFNFSPLYTRKRDKELVGRRIAEVEMMEDILRFKTTLQNSDNMVEVDRLERLLESDAKILAIRRELREAGETGLKNGAVSSTELLLKIREEAEAALQESIHRTELLKALYLRQGNGIVD